MQLKFLSDIVRTGLFADGEKLQVPLRISQTLNIMPIKLARDIKTCAPPILFPLRDGCKVRRPLQLICQLLPAPANIAVDGVGGQLWLVPRPAALEAK